MSDVSFVTYHYIECKVDALPLVAANVEKIVEVLAQDVADRLISSLNVEWTAGASVPTITFRYMDSTTDYVLTEGMYLLISSVSGRKSVMTAEEFLAAYAEGAHSEGPSVDNALVDSAIVDHAVLPE